MGKSTGTRLHHSVRTAVITAVVLGIMLLSTGVNAQSGTARHTYSEGIMLVSVPFDYTGDDATTNGNPYGVFGLSLTTPESDFRFLTWQVGSFYTYPDLPADKVRVGKGYFVYSPNSQPVVYASTSVSDLESIKPEPYVIDLQIGWNLIGCPYHGQESPYTARWYGNALSILVGDTEYAIRDAIAARIIKAGLWSYVGGRYELSYTFDEWKGYWVKAFQSCRLIVYKSEAARSRAASVAETSVPDIWSQKIVARAGSAADEITFGVATRATDGYDTFNDIEKPPAVEAGRYVQVSFPHPEWSANAGAYGVDVRSAGGRKAWEFTVESNVTDSDVVLTWPAIADLPKDTNLVLLDQESGARRFMRTCSGYQFRLGSGSRSRKFKIEASPAGQGMLKITGLSAAKSRSGSRTLSCNLSSGATVDVTVKAASNGRAVRKVVKGSTRSAGLNAFVWDCRDEAGTPVPAGVYMCEVRATGDDGQIVKAVTVVTVAR